MARYSKEELLDFGITKLKEIAKSKGIKGLSSIRSSDKNKVIKLILTVDEQTIQPLQQTDQQSDYQAGYWPDLPDLTESPWPDLVGENQVYNAYYQTFVPENSSGP